MQKRTKPLKAVMIAVSLIFLIGNHSSGYWKPEVQENAVARVAFKNNLRTEKIFDSSFNTGVFVLGLYDLSFRVYRNGSLEPVSSLTVGGGPLVLFAHVEDTNGDPAQSGTVTFESCGDYVPKETCDAGLARWTRLNRVSIGSCYCKSCGGLPGFDPGPGNACLFVFGTGGPGMEGDDGFRFKYAGGKRGVDSGMSGAANFTWTADP